MRAQRFHSYRAYSVTCDTQLVFAVFMAGSSRTWGHGVNVAGEGNTCIWYIIQAEQKDFRSPPRVALLAVSSGPLEMSWVLCKCVHSCVFSQRTGSWSSQPWVSGNGYAARSPVWTRPLILEAWGRCLQVLTWASKPGVPGRPTRADLLVPPERVFCVDCLTARFMIGSCTPPVRSGMEGAGAPGSVSAHEGVCKGRWFARICSGLSPAERCVPRSTRLRFQ